MSENARKRYKPYKKFEKYSKIVKCKIYYIGQKDWRVFFYERHKIDPKCKKRQKSNKKVGQN